MSPRRTHDRLQDVLDAIDTIHAHEAQLEQASIGRDQQVRVDAVVRQLAVVAEAATHLPDDLVAAEPSVNWRAIRGMRIPFDHGYHRVDPAIIWNAVDDLLDDLRAAVERLRAHPNADLPPRTPPTD